MAKQRLINEIIVHCSATAEGKDFTVDDIRRWHMAPPRKYSDIGYHFVIYRDGSIHTGRDINIKGAHVKDHNEHSIGVCYIGGCATDGSTPKDTRTPQQRTALRQLLTELCGKYPIKKICGHYQYAAKACPSFDISEYSDIINP